MNTDMRLRIPFVLLVLTATFALGQEGETRGASTFDGLVREHLAAHGPGIEASVWVGTAKGPASYRHLADTARPVASAIKTAYLIEFFARHAGKLDAPLSGGDALLDQEDHPAWQPFDAKTRDLIRTGLKGASVRRIGEVMIKGKGVVNAVYNAAANLVTADAGGPEALTRRMRARSPAFRGLVARRYMLARRDVTGDNEATADALGAALQFLAAGQVPGLDQATVAAARDVLFDREDSETGRHYSKSGALSTHPQTSILSGWWEKDGKAVVYVVMTTLPEPAESPKSAQTKLAATTRSLRDALVDAALTGAKGTTHPPRDAGEPVKSDR
jgi:hypothetical protein